MKVPRRGAAGRAKGEKGLLDVWCAGDSGSAVR